MFWIANTELSWPLALFVFSLVSIVSIGYFKFGNSFEGVHLSDYLGLSALVQKVRDRLHDRLSAAVPSPPFAGSIDTEGRKHSTFACKMTSFERKQSFIKRSLEAHRKQPDADQSDSSFIYSSIFAFTKTLINRANPLTNSVRKHPAELPDGKSNAAQPCSQPPTDLRPTSPARHLLRAKLLVHGTMSSMNTMSTLNESPDPAAKGLSKSVSLQIKDELKAMPRNRLLHQSSSSSNSSTPADLFSLAEKGRVGANLNFRKHKPLINNKVYQQQPSTYTELVSQIQSHEDAINREYLLHQLNPSQYHSMHYYRRLERQNCLGKRSSSKKIAKQDTVQSNSSNADGNNSNDPEHFTSSSSNLSCSECGSLEDTEEELTLPFIKKAGHYQPNVSLRSKQPLKLSSSLDKSGAVNPIIKQCSSDSNEAMVGLLNENLIKRQLTNYLKLSDRLTDKLSDKRKRILGRRLTAQNSFSAASSFNNSSNNSSFDHDDMLAQFAGHQANSFSSTETNHHFYYNNYENNSNDTSSSSNSSCGHRHAERTKTLNEFGHGLSICDNHAGSLGQFDRPEAIEPAECANNNILHVTHAYDPTTRKLKIRIVKADFVPMKADGDQRCYVKLILLPNKRQKFKTTTKSCSNNPIEFDELFTFNRVSPEAIMTLSIKYLLCLVDNESKHRNVGEALILFENRKPMQQEDNLIVYLDLLNVNSASSLQCNYNVIPKHSTGKPGTANANVSLNESLSDVSSICRSDSAESHHSIQLNLPELLIGLAYNATTGRLQVAIVRGSQFKAKSNKPPDTYVKCTLLSSAGHEIGRNKTTVKRSSPNPVYKQTFAFQVALFQLPDVSLMISVYNKKSMNRKELIGWFSMGCNSSGEEENSHWAEMRDSKGEQICRWHVLSES